MHSRFNLNQFESRVADHPLFADVCKISSELASLGRVCWIAGGAVRDFYLSRMPLDLDLVTDAEDHEILRLFPKAILVGQSYGVYKISLRSGEVIDLTVFREEDEYVDGRRPQGVRRSTPQKDAERRDFTMNALFWDLQNKLLVDYVHGVDDLENALIRCVGDAEFRFKEDHLRILRLLRFHAVLDFKMEPNSFQAALKLADLIHQISGERIWSEITKISTSAARKIFWSNPLGQKMAAVFGLEFKGNLWDKVAHFSKLQFAEPTFQILFEIMDLCDFTQAAASTLKLRFRLSRKQASFLDALQKEVERPEPLSFEKYCLLCDRSSEVVEILDNLSLVNRFDLSVVERLKTYLVQRPPDLVVATDLLNEIPNQFISRALIEIREQQLLGNLQGKQHALSWIRRAVLDWT